MNATRPNPAGVSCDPENAMKIILGVLLIVIVVGSVIADYKWRQWIAARKAQREHPDRM